MTTASAFMIIRKIGLTQNKYPLHFPRLPILQGGTFTFITPTLAILALPKWRCPDTSATPHLNATDSAALLVDGDEVWKVRIREVM